MTSRIVISLLLLFGSFSPLNSLAESRNPSDSRFSSDSLSSTLATLRDLAEQGDATAQAALGQMYYKGDGVSKNLRLAFTWLQKAAAQQHAGAELTLALMYAQGQTVKKDLTKAFAFASSAAEQGYAVAQRIVGNMYDSGKGAPKDLGKAFLWYQKAAIQGDVDAQYNLSTMYFAGEGVRIDKVLAYAWLKLAMDQHYASNILESRLLAKLEHSMTTFEISESQKMISSWIPGKALESKGSGERLISTDFIEPKLLLDYDLHEH